MTTCCHGRTSPMHDLAPWWLTNLVGDPIAWAVALAAAVVGGACGWALWTVCSRLRRPRRATGHAGATADWSPADEVADIDAHQLTPTELMPHHVVRPAVTVPDTDALE